MSTFKGWGRLTSFLFPNNRRATLKFATLHIGTFGSLLVRAVIGLAFFAILLSLPRTASAVLITQCPAIGGDTGCGILITINADGSVTVTTASAPTQPPYDGVEDTLIGVQNTTTLTSIPNITVSSEPRFWFGNGSAR
jgi:hypothetical protein